MGEENLFTSDFYNFMTNSPVTNILLFALIIVIICVYRSYNKNHSAKSDLTEKILESLTHESKQSNDRINTLIESLRELEAYSSKLTELSREVNDYEKVLQSINVKLEHILVTTDNCNLINNARRATLNSPQAGTTRSVEPKESNGEDL